MTYTPKLPEFIDSTMISAFRQCPRKFFLEFCHNLRPSDLSIHLHAGACFASALENTYKYFYLDGFSLGKALVRAYGDFMDQWGEVTAPEGSPKSRERVWKAVQEYFREWSPATDPIQPFDKSKGGAFEFTFSIPLLPIVPFDPIQTNMEDRDKIQNTHFPCHPSGQPFLYAGRFDLLGLWQSSIPIIRDEKTTTSIGASWADQWRLRSQFMGYVWACQQSGIDLETVAVRGIGILKTKISLAESIHTYSKTKIARWHEQLRRDLWRLRRAWDEQYFDFNFADACSSYGGCSFLPLCESDEPEKWFSTYSQRNWNPTLKNPVEEKAA